MRNALTVVVLVLICLVAGCTLSETAEQRNRRISQSMELQARMMVYDIDAILLLDRSSRLTPWHVRIGE